jgi:hypothetical protein
VEEEVGTPQVEMAVEAADALGDRLRHNREDVGAADLVDHQDVAGIHLHRLAAAAEDLLHASWEADPGVLEEEE